MAKIDSMSAGSGRRLKENDQVVNIADLIEQIANSGVTLTGSSVSIEERFWLSTDPDPVPVSNRALGVVIDVATNEMTTKYWERNFLGGVR